MTEQQADYYWFPNTANHGKEFGESEIVNRAASFLHKGSGYSGVYFLILDGEIVYVGKSVDVKSRLDQHSRNDGIHEKNFNKYFVILCKPEELNRLEAYYILRFRPMYNIAIPKDGTL